LNGIAQPLRTKAEDEQTYGIGNDPASTSDSMALLVFVDNLDGKWEGLPAPYGADVHAILQVATDPFAGPDQLNAAASDAQTLAQDINQLCLSSPL
jgi:hypothetical protein